MKLRRKDIQLTEKRYNKDAVLHTATSMSLSIAAHYY